MMDDIVNDSSMMKISTERSHHLKISVIFMTQNIFHPGKEARTMSLNTQYKFCLMGEGFMGGGYLIGEGFMGGYTPLYDFLYFGLRFLRYEKDFLQVLSKLSQASIVKIFQMNGRWFL